MVQTQLSELSATCKHVITDVFSWQHAKNATCFKYPTLQCKKKRSNSCLRKCRPHLKRLAASNEEAAIER